MDVLCISETWLCNNIPNEHIDIPEYKVYRCDKDRGEVYAYILEMFIK